MRSLLKPRRLLTRFRTRKLVAIACYLGIVSMLMMAWSVLFKAALPIVVGMGFGQVIGVIAFLLYALAVFGDIYRGDVDEVLPPSVRSLNPPPMDDGGEASTWEDEEPDEPED